MCGSCEVPLTLPSIAKQCKLSLRQIERLFHKYRSLTPSQYYLSLRLMHAKQLLLNTNRSVIDISIATGFEKAKNLGDLPPNICNPAYLAQEAQKLVVVDGDATRFRLRDDVCICSTVFKQAYFTEKIARLETRNLARMALG